MNLLELNRSAFTIKSIMDSIGEFLDSDDTTIEGYRIEPNILEARQDIRLARIGIYEDTDDVTDQVGNYRPNLSLTRYSMDVSIYRGYQQDNQDFSEFILLNIQDAIIEWSKTFEPSIITEKSIYSFGYIGAGTIIRFDRFATRTLNFTAIKELNQNLIL